jgi:hypothetical protein
MLVVLDLWGPQATLGSQGIPSSLLQVPCQAPLGVEQGQAGARQASLPGACSTLSGPQ